MKNDFYQIIMAFVIISFASFSNGVFAEGSTNRATKIELLDDAKGAQPTAKELSGEIEIIRRDQINYRIEKDLLKEAYATSLQSINLAITLMLGVFGLLGFFGLRSINDIKKEYNNELSEIRNLRAKHEVEIDALRVKQSLVEQQIKELSVHNEQQDARLKVMEVVEKVSGLIKAKNWRWALHWILAGLQMDQRNLILLNQKAHCHARLGEFSASADSHRLLCDLDQKDVANKQNLLEMLAITGNITEFNKVYKADKEQIDLVSGGNLSVYLRAISLITSDDFETAKTIITDYLNVKNEAPMGIDGWHFDDIKIYQKAINGSRRGGFIDMVIELFSKDVEKKDFLDKLNKL